jgi:endonuclease YncB( thermonuclease family)
MAAMEQASRIISVALGLAVMVFVLWPITIPVGFGEAWWARRQAQSQREAAAPKPVPAWQAMLPSEFKTPAPQPTSARHAVTSSGDSAPKPAAVPSEQPAPEQRAALTSKDQTGTIAPQDATKRYYRVTVHDVGTLQAGGVVIKLSDIAARDADATCKDDKGKPWRCGAVAKIALTRLIHGRAVTCALPKGGEHNVFLARCTVAGTDLSAWLVRQGWATPREPSEPALAAAAAAAKSERLGLWRSAE